MSSIKRSLEGRQNESVPVAEHRFKWSTKVDGQWVDLQCNFNDHGARCERYGTLSPSTNGHGPWYCRDHFGPGGVKAYGETGSSAGWVTAKSALMGVLSKREPGQD